MQIEEKILFKEIQKGNKEVFEALFHEYFPVLSRYAESFIFDRQASEDIVQDLFMCLWVNANQVTIHKSLNAYLYLSIKNRSLNYLRNLHIQDKHNLLYLEAMLNEDHTYNWIGREVIEKIKIAIDQLPPQMASVFKLKYLQGKKQKEIAESMKISKNTVKTQIYRGKEKLRKQLLELTSLNFI